MDKPIAVNDLVMVVRGLTCCGETTGSEGIPFVVTEITVCKIASRCMYCKQRFGAGTLGARGNPGTQPFDLDRLIKIDPPALPESVEHKESLTA